MKRKILTWSMLTLLSFCIVSSEISPVISRSFKLIFGKKYENALKTIHENTALIKQRLEADSIHLRLLTSIIFPELIRHNPFRDKLEQESLDLLYVEYGAEDGLDFSIGLFQMRPSFSERLEAYMQSKESYFDKEFHFFESLYTYTQTEKKEERQERVNRLKNVDWQIQYLRCFYHILEDKFCIGEMPVRERVLFAATAYNRGFHCTEEEIKKWEKIENFPFGKSFFTQNKKQYIYGEVALDYFLKQTQN
jgi:hypothetical protein